MCRYKLSVPGVPVAKARPKVTRFGVYTPEKTKNYEVFVRELFFAEHGQLMLEGGLCLAVTAYFPIPKSASIKTRQGMAEGSVRPIKRPDIDNVIKAISDALNGIAYADDSQIVEVRGNKYYSVNPRVDVEIRRC